MNRLLLSCMIVTASLWAMEIPTAHVQMHKFGQSVALNSKIIQLSNAKQSVTSLVEGHLEKYFVKAGELVKKGQKIALIESIFVSKMTADYLSLQQQYSSLNKNYEASKELYEKGMISMQKINNIDIKKNAMSAKIIALQSQLQTLEIDAKNLKKATANFILYAHSSGRVAKLHLPLHTVVRVDETLISVIKEQAFYVKSYLPLEYAHRVKVGQKLILHDNSKNITAHVRQILPEVDAQTQRIVVLSSIDEKVEGVFIGSYVASKLYFQASSAYASVKKSALSCVNNEWVVFVPTKKEEHEEHDEHDEVPFEACVIEIVAQDDIYVGVKGLQEGEEYVSSKSYFVKSMILKSSLGGHGH